MCQLFARSCLYCNASEKQKPYTTVVNYVTVVIGWHEVLLKMLMLDFIDLEEAQIRGFLKLLQ